MKIVSDSYKTAIRSPSRTLGARVEVIASPNIIINDENLERIEIDNGILTSEQFVIGGGIASSISVSINNYDEKFEGINFEGKLMKVFFKIQLVDGTWEEVFYNNYWIEECKKTGKNIKLEGFDKLATDILDSKYSSTLTFPAKVSDIVYDMRRLAVDFGYNLKNNTYSFNDLMIPQKPQGSFRQVLTDIATIAGGFLVCLSGLVDIYVLNDTDVEITNNNSFKTTVSNSFSDITGVIVNGYEVGSNTGNVLRQEIALLNGISEGYLEAIAVNMLNYYKTTQYVGFNSEWQGDFAMEVCDKIKVYDEKDVPHLSIVTNNKIRYCGGLKATTQAKISKKQVENKTAREQYVETQVQENNMGIYTYTNESAVQVPSNILTDICTLEYETSSNSNLLLFVTIQINATALVECKFYIDDVLCALNPKVNVVNFGALSFNYAVVKVLANEKHKLIIKLLSSADIAIDANQVQVALFGQKIIGGISPDVVAPPIEPEEPTPQGTWEIKDCPTYSYSFGAVDNGEIFFNDKPADGKYKYNVSTNTFTKIFNGGNRTTLVTQCIFFKSLWFHIAHREYLKIEGQDKTGYIPWYAIALPNTEHPPRCYVGLGAYGNKIYIAGGNRVNPKGEIFEPVSTFNEVDFLTKNIKRVKDMPQARTNLKLQECSGNIYGFGGGVNTVLKYNISADTWTEVSTLPNNSTSCRFCWCNEDKIYIVVDSNVYLFNPLNNTWGNVATLPETIKNIQLIVGENNKMYCMGGVDVVSNASKIAILTL